MKDSKKFAVGTAIASALIKLLRKQRPRHNLGPSLAEADSNTVSSGDAPRDQRGQQPQDWRGAQNVLDS